MDIYKITLWVPDLKALNKVLSVANVQHECGRPKQDTDGNFMVTLYATPTEASKVTALNYRHQVDKNYGKVLKQRQKQVSTIDRFKGGKVKPVGLGVKK